MKLTRLGFTSCGLRLEAEAQPSFRPDFIDLQKMLILKNAMQNLTDYASPTPKTTSLVDTSSSFVDPADWQLYLIYTYTISSIYLSMYCNVVCNV
jgi:hypothetical protein